MQQRMGDTSSNLGAANTELAELKSQVSVLKQQLDKAKSELNASTSQITILKVLTAYGLILVCLYTAHIAHITYLQK